MRISDWSSGRVLFRSRTSDGTPPQLCIHYRPDILPLERVRQLARSAGAELTEQYQHLLWDDLEGVGHARRARTISDRLRKVPGVIEAEELGRAACGERVCQYV